MPGGRQPRYKVTAEVMACTNQLYRARAIAVLLRDEKGDHPWSQRECELFSRLLIELQVEAPPK